MKYRVDLSARARAQLDAMHAYIAEKASPAIASDYVEKIAAYCEGLSTFPHRGTRRDDVVPGLRKIGYRKRVTIAFAVEDFVVTILGIFYGGQDWESALRDDAAEEPGQG